MEGESRRRGPKPQGPIEDKRRTLTTRITDEMRQRLETASRETGRSLSQEIELRLQQSFRDEQQAQHFQEAVYGRQLAGLLALLGRVMKDAGSFAAFAASPTIEAASNWMDSEEGRRAAARASLTILAEIMGDKSLSPPSDDGLDVRLARGALEAVANPERGGEIGIWAAPIRAMLGEIATRISIDLTDPISVALFRPETGRAGVATMGKNKVPES